jgi:DNA-binding CsgD family transcriptional regulator
VFERAVEPPPEPLSILSSREAEVLQFTSLGLTNSQVAARLDVSIHAVKFHLGAIYRKLGVSNRTEAAVVYLRTARLPAEGRERT